MTEPSTHFLYPSTIFASREPHIVNTILGSCVGVCFYDTFLKYGGINHYMLPFWNGQGLASPKFGNIAIHKLFEKMQSLGSSKRNLVAKLFGGGNIIEASNALFMIGDRNIMLAFQMLEEFRIPVVAKDVGGRIGRKIIMDSSTGVVLVGKGRKPAPESGRG